MSMIIKDYLEIKVKNFTVILMCLLVSGCVTAKFGEEYKRSEHAIVTGGNGVVIIYADSEIEQGIVYQVWVNDKDAGFVFPDSFIRIISASGESIIRFWERIDSLSSELPASYTALGTPFSFTPGVTRQIDVKAGDVYYIRIRKQHSEYFAECGETEEAITVCKKKRYKTMIEQVESSIAMKELSGMKESL